MTGIRYILVLAMLGLGLGLGTGPAMSQSAEPAAESFLIGALDIPLMPGLTEDEAATVYFDKPAGRILIASPAGCVDQREARRFYGVTLPQLGWLPAPKTGPGAAFKLVYLREGERLTLEFSASNNDCAAMRFLLSPVPEAQ